MADPARTDALLDAQDRSKNRRNTVVAITAFVLACLMIILVISITNKKQDVESERNSAADQVVSLADQIQRECALGRLSGPICQNAARAKVDPVPGNDVSSNTPTTPTSEQIAAAVSSYLVLNPPPAGPGPTQAQIAAAVTTYLVMNPPADGRPPTNQEISDAVNSYIALNPPARGEPGRPPTSAEIAAAVDAWLTANPPPAGPKGDKGDAGVNGTNGTNGTPGAPGVGIKDVSDPQRPDGVCIVRFTLTDDSFRDVTVPDEFCGTGAVP